MSDTEGDADTAEQRAELRLWVERARRVGCWHCVVDAPDAADAIEGLLDTLDAAEVLAAAYVKAVRVAYAYLRAPRMDGSHVPNAKDVLEAVRRDWPYKDPLEAEAAALRARAEWAEAAIRAALEKVEMLDEVDWNGMGPWNGIYHVLAGGLRVAP